MASDWRDWVPPAVVRVLIGATCTTLPAFEDRLGQVAFPIVWLALAVFAILAAITTSRSEAVRSWPLNAVDGLTLATLVPTVVVASRIEVADSRLGGATMNFLAAAGAVLAVVTIVSLVAALACAERPDTATIALLPAALTVAAIIAGAERFAADNVAQGLTAVWIVAGVATLCFGVANQRARSMVSPVAFAMVAVVATALAGDGMAEVTTSNTLIAILLTAATGGLLLLAPAGAVRASVYVTESVESGDSAD
ncbi:MAG: hypothetical protein ACRD1H_04945 [Vicinamibacterales bacterium]